MGGLTTYSFTHIRYDLLTAHGHVCPEEISYIDCAVWSKQIFVNATTVIYFSYTSINRNIRVKFTILTPNDVGRDIRICEYFVTLLNRTERKEPILHPADTLS
jgi:hypothetical protein